MKAYNLVISASYFDVLYKYYLQNENFEITLNRIVSQVT